MGKSPASARGAAPVITAETWPAIRAVDGVDREIKDDETLETTWRLANRHAGIRVAASHASEGESARARWTTGFGSRHNKQPATIEQEKTR
jgi:hypothetical protein